MYDEAIKLLTSKGNFYIDLSLERISQVLEKLGNPQDKLKYIHVAGTNGKGSVCAILASVLKEAGYRVGLYTSPHIWEYTERIRINGVEIPKEEFAKLVFEIAECGIHLTEFEILTVVMFLFFLRNNVEVVILETGLGGRLDATNVIKENICSVITQIDLDHTDRLGTTKDEIAFEKAGIIKQNCPVITSMGFEPIKDKADEMNSMFIMSNPFAPSEFIEALTLKGYHQVENLALAVNVLNEFFKEIDDETIIKGLKKVSNPCRFEYFEKQNLIVDACHNPNGVRALKENLDYYFPNTKKRYIFGCLKNKDYEKMLNILFEEGDEVYLNGFDYLGACTFEELKEKCPVEAIEYKGQELKPNKLNIVCGSFYMIGGMEWLKYLRA